MRTPRLQRTDPLISALPTRSGRGSGNLGRVQRRCMKPVKLTLTLLFLIAAGTFSGCSRPATKSADVAGDIRKSLDQSILKDVSVSQDRDKGVVTLGGHVASDADKAQAESIAKSQAAGQVIANEIAVTPSGAEGDARTVNKDLDAGIEKNLDAELVTNKLNKSIRTDVKNGVVTLKGEVNSQAARERVEKIASRVPNVQQVVNEIEVKDQK